MPLLRAALATVAVLVSACAAPVTDEVAPAQTSPPSPSGGLGEDDLGVIRAWSFEAASADCNGWSASGGTSIRGVPSHSGTYACKLCADGSSATMQLSRRVAGLPAGRYVVSAWLRRHASSGGGAPMSARIGLGSPLGSRTRIGDEWQAIGDWLDVDTDIAAAHVTVFADVRASGQCLLVDDVVVGRR